MNPFDVLHYTQEYISSYTYGVGDVAEYSGINYVSMGNANNNNTPNSSPSWWASLSAPDPLAVGSLGPQAIVFANGPQTLTSGTNTTLLSATIPQGVYAVTVKVGNITISLGGFGTVSTLYPLTLVNPDNGTYEGFFAFGNSSGLNIISNQGPGSSYATVLTAKPVTM